MHGLFKTTYCRYEVDQSDLVAVSTNISKLKAKAVEDTAVYDQQWTDNTLLVEAYVWNDELGKTVPTTDWQNAYEFTLYTVEEVEYL